LRWARAWNARIRSRRFARLIGRLWRCTRSDAGSRCNDGRSRGRRGRRGGWCWCRGFGRRRSSRRRRTRCRFRSWRNRRNGTGCSGWWDSDRDRLDCSRRHRRRHSRQLILRLWFVDRRCRLRVGLRGCLRRRRRIGRRRRLELRKFVALRRLRLGLGLNERRMMYDRCNARDVWNGRGLLRRRRHLRNSRRSLLEGNQRSAGDRLARAFL
jgi:hypothetical protein